MDTKQQLDSVQRYKAGYYSDEWGVRGSTPTCIPAHDGAWVRFADMQALQAGYDAAQLEIESLQARIQELGQMARECSDRKVVQLESALAMHVRSGKDWAMRVEVLERNIVMLRAQIASHAAQVAAGKKAMRELESANSIALQACARVKELEAQPDAIGAVEPLRKTDTAARGTDAQIIKERKLCAYAFAGAVADGLSGGTGPDSQESEWLRPAFEAGQEIAQLRAEIDQLRKRQCLHQISEPDHLRGATKMARAVLTNAFLADVMTAAGLVSHGKQCKALGKRMAAEAMRLRTAEPQLSLQPLPDWKIDAIRIEEALDQWEMKDAALRYMAREIERAHGITGDEA